MPAYLFLAAALTLNALANVLIKYSMEDRARPLFAVQGTVLAPVASYLTWSFLAGIFCFAMNLLCYSLALRTLKLSIAYPLMVSLGYIAILIFQWMFQMGERLTLYQYVGVGLILVGIWFVVSR
jgi:undecaprenyl phosphate-alpha-L-ara4N flippase subunit ArnF